jgi:hypothetical protein
MKIHTNFGSEFALLKLTVAGVSNRSVGKQKYSGNIWTYVNERDLEYNYLSA